MIRLHRSGAEIFIPDGTAPEPALARTTCMGIGAHQDDLEILAAHGILQAFARPDQWFAGVIVTNGSGSPRAGVYADCSDEQMMVVRRREQKKAAQIGEFGALALLDYPSGAVKNPADTAPVDDLVALLEAARPRVVYTHNLADKHDTHVGVALKVVAALRRLPPELRPEKVWGGEVWRDLDWLADEDKVVLDVSGRDHLAAALVGVFDSQISGGKRYDLATLGRRRANATYFASHATDTAESLIFAMDLTPLVRDPDLDPAEFVRGYIRRFEDEVAGRLRKLGAAGAAPSR
jgi:LmbE family N-acetylglucosaminyl deacetylase